MTDISAHVVIKMNDKIEDKITQIFDAGIGLVAQDLVKKAKDMVAVDTGALRKSIDSHKVRMLEWKFVSGGATTPYAVLQELGHVAGRKYKFTPFMRPAVVSITNNKQILDKDFGNKLKSTPGFAEAVSASAAIGF